MLLGRASAPVKAIALVPIVGVIGVAATLALASKPPRSPRITAHPASHTVSGTARFAFTGPGTRVTFFCSLDRSRYRPCGSGVRYRRITGGRHTFAVIARDRSGQRSSPTRYRWIVDRVSPSITVTSPAPGRVYDAASWSHGCATSDQLCGTASDPAGVTAVEVSIQQNATGMYWDGAGFATTNQTYRPAALPPAGTTRGHSCAIIDVGTPTHRRRHRRSRHRGGRALCLCPRTRLPLCTRAWSYPLTLPADGTYTLHVRARDELRNLTPATSPTRSVFTIGAAPVPPPSGTDSFTIGGDLATPLTPGSAPAPIDLALSNPNGDGVAVDALTVRVASVSAPNSSALLPCSTADFATTAYTGAGFMLPPGTSTLASLGVPQSEWPAVAMIDAPTDQDGCRGATLLLSYDGSGRS